MILEAMAATTMADQQPAVAEQPTVPIVSVEPSTPSAVNVMGTLDADLPQSSATSTTKSSLEDELFATWRSVDALVPVHKARSIPNSAILARHAPTSAPPASTSKSNPSLSETVGDLAAKQASGPTEHQLFRGLSMLGQAASPQYGLVYRKLSLPGQGIKDMSFVRKFPMLEYLDLASNAITNASDIDCLPYLFSIDLSNNRISKFDPEQAPYNLQDLDLSRNQLMSIVHLHKHPYLRNVCLDRNLVKSLAGLENCHFLTHLSISNNAVMSLAGLESLPIQYLDLRRNRVRSIRETASMPHLEHLLLSYNELPDLPTQLSTACSKLLTLHLDYNMLSSETDVLHLQSFPRLRDLRLRGNPLGRDASTYRLRTLYLLPKLLVLDGLTTGVSEKVAAGNAFNPPRPVIEAVSHAKALAREARLYAPLLAPDWGIDRMLASRSDSVVDGNDRFGGVDDDEEEEEEEHDGREVGDDEDDTTSVGSTVIHPDADELATDFSKLTTSGRFPQLHVSDTTGINPHSLYFSSNGLGGTPCPFLPLIICGPAGVGKRTLINKLLKEFPQIFGTVISHTTRKPRQGERHGVDYYFVNKEDIDQLVKGGKMASVVSLFGHLYGTSIESCERVKNEGKIGIVAMEMEGAMALYRSKFPARFIFVSPPSLDALASRLQARQKDRTIRRYHVKQTTKKRGHHGPSTLIGLATGQSSRPPSSGNAGSSSPSRSTTPTGTTSVVAGHGGQPFGRPRTSSNGSVAPRLSTVSESGIDPIEASQPDISAPVTVDAKNIFSSLTSLTLPSTGSAGSLDELSAATASDDLPDMIGWTLGRYFSAAAAGDKKPWPVLTGPKSRPPEPFECVLVNDDLETSYAALRRVAMKEFTRHYHAQVEEERMRLDASYGMMV